MTQTSPVIDGRQAIERPDAGSERRVWLLLVDPLPNRIFFDCGIVDALRRELDDRLTAVWLVHEKHIRPWLDREPRACPTLTKDDLMPVEVPFGERVARRVDIELDRRIGFFPLAVRHSFRHGFHEGRWVSGSPQLPARSRPRRAAAPLGVPRGADGALVLLAARRYVPVDAARADARPSAAAWSSPTSRRACRCRSCSRPVVSGCR